MIHVAADGSETVWTRGTQYDLSGDGTMGTGQLDVTTTPADFTPATGTTVVILLYPDLLQEVDLPGGDFTGDIEQGLDIGRQVDLRQQDEIDRTPKFAEGSTASNKAFPDPVADSAIVWNGAGAALETRPVADLTGFSTTYLGAFGSDPSVQNDGTSLVIGNLYFNSSLSVLRTYDGTIWRDAVAAVAFRTFTYTAAGGETQVSGADDDGKTLAYEIGDRLRVFRNGILLDDADYTATSGSSISNLSALTAGDILFVEDYSEIAAVGTLARQDADAVDIDGGAIDGAIIGASTPTAATFTDVTASGAAAVDSMKVGAGGDTSPLAPSLLVTRAGTSVLSVRDSTNNVENFFYADGAQGMVGTYTTHPLRIRTDNTNAISVGAGQNVGIGQDAPQELLHVGPGADASQLNACLGLFSSTGDSGLSVRDSSSNTEAYLFVNGSSGYAGMLTNHPFNLVSNNTTAVTIDTTRNVLPGTTEVQDLGSPSLEWDTIYLQNAATVSDSRRKTLVGDISWAVDFIKEIDPKIFTLNNRGIPATTRMEHRQKTEIVNLTEMVLENVGGQYREVERTHAVERKVFHDHPVFDAAGNPIMDGSVQRVYREPVMETVEIDVPAETVEHGRPHTGVLAQQVKSAMDNVGVSDWAGYAYDAESDTHHIRYLEFIGVLLAANKELIARVEALELGGLL